MIKQYIVRDDLTLADAKEVFKDFNDLINDAVHHQEDGYYDEWVGLKELCTRLRCAKQTAYNRNRSGVWLEGVHFIKPSGGKLLYKWAVIKAWAENQESVSIKLYPSFDQPPAENNQSMQHPPATPSSCAPNKEFVNI